MLEHKRILSKIKGNIYPYYSPINVESANGKFIGYLYFDVNSTAMRFDYKSNKLSRVAIFFDFKMGNSPNYYLDITDDIDIVLNKVLKNKSMVLEFKSEVDLHEGDKETYEPQNEPDFEIPDDIVLDVFKQMELYTLQVAYGSSNALLVTGLGGLGKTTTVEEALSEIRKSYVEVGGDISDAGLYEKLFLHRKDLILFDDCDAVFKTASSLNILKKVLDTKPNRKVSRAMKGYFQAFGKTDSEIEKIYEKTKKLPNEFIFTGQIIFISNLTKAEIASKDAALLTRILHVDVMLDRDAIIDRMKNLISKVLPKISMDIKLEAFKYLLYLYENYELTDELNMRTLVHFINTRVANDMPIVINGRTYKAWMVLCKNTYTVKKRA